MCLAIWKPEGAIIQKHELRNGFIQNDDGAGLAYAKDGKLVILKGFFKFKKFYKVYNAVKDYPMVIHFRWATHGLENTANCHPFSLCGGKFALIHNGVLPIDTKSEPSKSDTAHFAELVLSPMLHKVDFDNPALRFLVEEAIGKFNKLVVLRHDGEFVIYNESAGHWHNGSWFSNHDYEGWATKACTAIGFGKGGLWSPNRPGALPCNTDYAPAKAKEAFPDYEPGKYQPLSAQEVDDLEEEARLEAEAEQYADNLGKRMKQAEREKEASEELDSARYAG